MKVRIDLDRVTLDDLIVFDEGGQTLRFVRDFLARFLVDETTNEYMPEAEARKAIGRLSVPEIKSFTEQVKTAIQGAMENTVPPAQSGG